MFFTGPIEAGLIDKVFIPIAAKQSASIGLPASSPQKDSLVPFFSHFSTTVFKKSRNERLSVSYRLRTNSFSRSAAKKIALDHSRQ